ncbi:MAG: cell division protein FtsA [Spirochaetales bacterium]|nr:cell division protein FtsA [Spirochaetales bacterium]
MPSDIVITGLDIGTTKVCAVIGEFDDEGNLIITGLGTSPSFGLRRGVVINIESTLKSVTAAIEAAELMSGREVSGVFTGIAGNHIEGTNSRGVVAVTGKDKEITQADVDRVIEAARAMAIPMDREIIHVIPQEFVVDGQGGIRNPLDMIGVRLEAEIHIITGSVTSAQNLVKCVNRAGFRVEDIVLESLAAARAVLSKEEKELGSLFIDMGGGTTDILVYMDGSPYYTSVIPIGGAQVTGDISIMLKTPVDSAEKIKREAGCCYPALVEKGQDVIIPGLGGRPPLALPRGDLCAIIQPRAAEIFTMARDKIEAKGFAGKLSGGVVLTGGGALLPGVVELAQDIFGSAARVGIPARLGGLAGEFQSPDYASAVGLVMFGAEYAQPGAQEAGRDKPLSGGILTFVRKWLKNFFE